MGEENKKTNNQVVTTVKESKTMKNQIKYFMETENKYYLSVY